MTDSNNMQQIKAIEAVLFDYATVLDNKDYASLANIFTKDAQVEYVGIDKCVGPDQIQALVSTILDKCAATQHIISNVIINVKGETAEASCYLQGVHVGIGDHEGEIMTAWGQYIDELILSDGQWLISKRQLRFFGTQGDIGLL
ncbi:MAG: nuclear transport factor 2 family protein [Spongiibacteraceae bacterium]